MKQTVITTIIAAFGFRLCIALAINVSFDISSEKIAQVLTGLQIGNSALITANRSNDICHTTGCAHAASKVLEYMDMSVEPCDNFYRFACGKFLKETVIPNAEIGVSEFSILSDKVNERLKRIISEPSTPNEIKSSRLAKNLYKLCMNKDRIEEKGLLPLQDILNELGGWPVVEKDTWNNDSFQWTGLVSKLHSMGYSINYFLDLSIVTDPKNSTKRVISFDEASLPLSRENLLEGLHDKAVRAYYDYMVKVAVLLGAEQERAERELLESLEFEMKLANISLSQEERRNITLLYDLMTIAELKKTYPSIPWKEYINHLLPRTIQVDDDEIIMVAAPSFIKNFEKLMNETSNRIQANYGIWRVIAESVDYLNDEIRENELKMLTVVSGKTKRDSRWKECMKLVSENLPLSVGALYARNYFNESTKKAVAEIVHDIREQFDKTLQNVDWMDNETRHSAIDKAASMMSHIAYPDEFFDDKKLEEYYEGLEIEDNDYLQQILNVKIFQRDNILSKLRKPVNRSDWVTHGLSHIVDAFYEPTENSIQLPAAILQGIFFGENRPKYMNYGALGYIIGHEITHGFDDLGRQYDKEGNLVDWWASFTKEKFIAKAQCIIEQYGNYTVPEAEMKLNGINTQGENIADNGGIKEAYRAYNEWSNRNGPEPMLPNLSFTPRQMFWISAANSRCSIYRSELLKYYLPFSSHPAEEFRVVGPFSNFLEFSRDFECPLGSNMNPVHKCAVW